MVGHLCRRMYQPARYLSSAHTTHPSQTNNETMDGPSIVIVIVTTAGARRTRPTRSMMSVCVCSAAPSALPEGVGGCRFQISAVFAAALTGDING